MSHRIAAYKSAVIFDIDEDLDPFCDSRIQAGHIFIYKNIAGQSTVAYFLCPCGDGEIIRMSLRHGAEGHPAWACTVDDDGNVTFDPSINYLSGCKSHFRVIAGKVVWV